MEKRLTPIPQSNADWQLLEEAIRELFRKEIYLPLIRIIVGKKGTLKNTKEDLIDAIAKGRISYSGGRFTGRFDAKTSGEIRRMGGVWRDGGWDLPQSDLPADVQRAVEVSVSRLERTLAKIDEKLGQILPEEIADKVDFKKIFDTTLWKQNKKIEDQVKSISVSPNLVKDRIDYISDQYTENMKLYIQGWTAEEIVKLRKDVQKHAFKGDRYEALVDVIQRRYQVGKSKATFLARQETNLLLAKYKQSRYTDAGITEYIWKNVAGSEAHPVRDMHEKLDETRQRWDNPPITSPQGHRNHPGEDFNCRCFAIPIVQIERR